MVSIVVVSHSEKVAAGAVEIANEMNMGGIKIVAAGGTGNGGIGTNAELIIDAFNSVNNSGTNYENVANITIDEGAVLELWCRPTRKGSVKVKEVKKKK